MCLLKLFTWQLHKVIICQMLFYRLVPLPPVEENQFMQLWAFHVDMRLWLFGKLKWVPEKSVTPDGLNADLQICQTRRGYFCHIAMLLNVFHKFSLALHCRMIDSTVLFSTLTSIWTLPTFNLMNTPHAGLSLVFASNFGQTRGWSGSISKTIHQNQFQYYAS